MALDAASLETLLIKGDFTASQLRDIVDQSDILRPWKPGDPFPIGIIRPDGVRVRVSVPAGDIGSLVGDLVSVDAPIRSWKVFPIGIIAPDRFEVDIDIGQPFG